MYRRLKKYLKSNESSYCVVGNYVISWFITYDHDKYWLLAGEDYDGEGWSCSIQTKDFEHILKENKNRYKIGGY